ncbi:MAG: hypothetical protein IKQ22_00700 [Clostridia bacterium]|nr:hypothetical protein [Clostridia bacterium]
MEQPENEMSIETRLQQYLRSNYTKEALQDSLNYDTVANILIDVAKKFDGAKGQGKQRTEEEYHTLVKNAISNFMNSDAANGEGQDKAHNLGKGQDPNERFQNIASSVYMKYY